MQISRERRLFSLPSYSAPTGFGHTRRLALRLRCRGYLPERFLGAVVGKRTYIDKIALAASGKTQLLALYSGQPESGH